MSVFVEEFLYRGRAPDSSQSAAWHVVLGNEINDGFGKKVLVVHGPISPTVAKDLGYDLPMILAEINTTTLNQLETVQSDKEALTIERDALITERDILKAELDELKNDTLKETEFSVI